MAIVTGTASSAGDGKIREADDTSTKISGGWQRVYAVCAVPEAVVLTGFSMSKCDGPPYTNDKNKPWIHVYSLTDTSPGDFAWQGTLNPESDQVSTPRGWTLAAGAQFAIFSNYRNVQAEGTADHPVVLQFQPYNPGNAPISNP